MCNVLHAYQFPRKYRPGNKNQLVDAFYLLPLPATADDYDECRLIEPGGVEVSFCWSEWCHTEAIVASAVGCPSE